MERLVICAQDPVVDIGVLSSEQMGGAPLPLPIEGGTLTQQMEAFEGRIIRDAYAKIRHLCGGGQKRWASPSPRRHERSTSM